MARKQDGFLTIGRVAEVTGIPATTLRFYEREGILAPAARTLKGYRLYDEEAVAKLTFIRSAQGVGFTLDDIRALLGLSVDTDCGKVQDMIERRLKDIDHKLSDLKRVRSTLADARRRCEESDNGCSVLIHLKGRSSANQTSD